MSTILNSQSTNFIHFSKKKICCTLKNSWKKIVDSEFRIGWHVMKKRLGLIAKIFFAIFMLKIALQMNYWKTKYKPQAQHSIKCPLFSAVKCNLTEKIKDHFHKSSNTDDQNRHMSQFSVNFTGAKNCKVFCLPFSVFSQLLRINFHPPKAEKFLVTGIWGFVELVFGFTLWYIQYSCDCTIGNCDKSFLSGVRNVLLLTEWEK